MGPLVLWTNSALRFMACFAGASLVALAVYWVFHGRGGVRQFFRVVLPAFALYVVVINIVTVYQTDDLAALFLPTTLLIGFATLTAIIENALAAHRLTVGFQWVRSLGLHLCTLAVGGIFYVPQDGLGWNSSPAVWGYVLGLLLGPLSIAGLRLMTRDLELRPGFDQPISGD